MREEHETALTWSRYNRLFESGRFGLFLYNALSNTMLKLDEPHYRALEALRDSDGVAAGAAHAHMAGDPGLSAQLRDGKVLVAPGEEKAELLTRRYAREALHFATSALGLTVCPTLACNFRCPYCFEHSQTDGTAMSPDTVDRLLAFIASHTDARRLGVTWYGGEPTLAWDTIRDITERVLKLDLTYENAGLVTNGYLLDAGKIAQLADLRITSIQVTLDGPRAVHDQRRVLPGGRPTYERILANLDTLMGTSWEGRCAIRVNVDKHNLESFLGLREELLGRYDDKRLAVYAGHVHTDPGDGYGDGCSMDGCEWADYTLGLYAEAMLLPTRGFFPSAAPGGCVANAHQGWVVGPAGELYKCWEDVGRPEMVVGSVHADPVITDPELRARYSIGTDPYEDAACLACDALPICGGGCPNKRLRALQSGEEGLEFCSPYKHHLEAYLEAYYDTFLTREICAAVLGSGTPEQDDRGWRVVSPAPARPDEGQDPLAGPIPATADLD